MTKKLELKFLTSANTELLVSIADPKDGLALSAVQAEAAKIMPVLANGKGVGAAGPVHGNVCQLSGGVGDAEYRGESE